MDAGALRKRHSLYYSSYTSTVQCCVNQIKGYGPAVDEIDFACFAHSKCWGCAKAEHGDECDGLNVPYKWKFIKDEATDIPVDIKCRKLN